MQATIYDEINELLETLLVQMQAVLGKKLPGLYLYGSATAGDFERAVSDIDLLAVIETDLTAQEFIDLEKMHRVFVSKYPAWKNRIEVAYLSVNGLQSFKRETSKIAVISPGEPLNVKEAGNDWLINWYAVQENGMVLIGPNQSAFIPRISKAEFYAAVRAQARHWRERIKHYDAQSTPGSLAYAVFTMCRGMYACQKGEQTSKKQAAAWLAKEFPRWATLIDDAIAWRAAQWNEPQQKHETALPRVVEFVGFATGKILDQSLAAASYR
jgi:predicted nucleotidyltransferase